MEEKRRSVTLISYLKSNNFFECLKFDLSGDINYFRISWFLKKKKKKSKKIARAFVKTAWINF